MKRDRKTNQSESFNRPGGQFVRNGFYCVDGSAEDDLVQFERKLSPRQIGMRETMERQTQVSKA